jgi:ABC-type dipeptide/oligopeptide/nickel transport system permease component
MKNILRDVTLKSAKTIFDLIARVALFFVVITPFIFFKFPQINELFKSDIFFSSTGFYIPDLLAESLWISIKLIFCSLIISAYFALTISLISTFSREFYWLSSLFVIASTIPVFITAYYLPYILFLIFGLILLLSTSLLQDKPFITFGLAAVLLILAVTVISYANKTGYLDVITQTRPVYIPGWIMENFSSITEHSIFFTENIMPWLGLILTGLIFFLYYRKYPLNASLIITLFLGALFVYGIIIYGYQAQVEDTYLLAPILTLSIGNLVLGLFINQIKEGIAEELQHDYIKAAMAKGASLWNHLKKKVLLTVLNTLKSQFALLLSLTVVVEKIYNLEGIGYLAWEYATQESDFVTVAWIVGMCFVLVWMFNAIIDICTFFFSPR